MEETSHETIQLWKKTLIEKCNNILSTKIEELTEVFSIQKMIYSKIIERYSNECYSYEVVERVKHLI